MSGISTYLYGIMRAGTEVPSGAPGIDDGATVSLIETGPLAAVTSSVARDGFESDGPADPAWVVPRALRHERVIETMLARGPILPVRFGALFSTRQALEAWIAANTEAISRFLDQVDGKEEWTIKVHVELGAAFEALIARDPAWADRAARLPASPGARYFQEKQLREQARTHVQRRARAAAELVRGAARAHAEERALVPRRPDERDVEPVAHLAYLVPRAAVNTFLSDVRHAAQDVPCLRLSAAGPWAPAHFCPRFTEPR